MNGSMMTRILLVLFAMLAIAPASAQTRLFLELEGEDQGSIDGDSNFALAMGQIELSRFWASSQLELSPTGQPSGRRSTFNIEFEKEFDSATVEMLQALSTSERMLTCVLRQYGEDMTGQLLLELEIELENALLVSQSGSAEAASPANELWEIAFDAATFKNDLTSEEFFDTEGSYGASGGAAAAIER